MINIAVLGYGIVGSGVVEVLNRNSKIISKKANDVINLKYVLDIRDFKDDPIEKFITKDFNDILNDDSIKIIVEVMGGVDIAYTFIKDALLNGKHVVTSNKDLVAQHGTELLKIAKDKNINFLFEASVAGAIPILRNTKESLISDEITEIKGIFNGTTNFILTNMMRNNQPFDVALKEAQELGYAEKNPREDIEGFDTARKIAIISSLITGKYINYTEFSTEGITNITPEDVEFTKSVDGTLKLIAHAKKVKNGFAIKVSPVVVSNQQLMSNVDYAFNAVSIEGPCTEELIFYGKGAGKLPTATAVMTDIINVANNLDQNIGYNWTDDKEVLYPYETVQVDYFIRCDSDDKDKTISSIKNIFKLDSLEVIQNDKYNHQLAFVIEDTTKIILEEKLKTLKSEGINILSKFILER